MDGAGLAGPIPYPFQAYQYPSQQHEGLSEQARQPAGPSRQACHPAILQQRPPRPAQHSHNTRAAGQLHSSLTHSLQVTGQASQAATAPPALLPAAAGTQQVAAAAAATSCFARPAAAPLNSWQAAYGAQARHPGPLHGLAAGGGASSSAHQAMLGGHERGSGDGSRQVAAPWPTLQQTYSGSYELFNPHTALLIQQTQQQAQQRGHMQQHAQAQAEAAEAAAAAQHDAAVRQESKRARRRKPAAQRSLLDLFAAAAIEEQSELSSEDADSDCEMMSSQESPAASVSPFSAFASAASPCTPFSHDAQPVAASPSPAAAAAAAGLARGGSASGSYAILAATPAALLASAAPLPEAHGGGGGGCGTAAAAAAGGAAAADHLLPLQHLLMSERAQHLTALEIKVILWKVAADLATLHDAGILHRHVTIASVALSRSGNLGTSRLMGHPYNVDAGQGRRYIGSKKAGVDAYLAPELARCPIDCVAYTPAGDLFSLGVVLFVLLSGSHVPFGNRGLCWTSIPNMPGPQESVDKLQRWLEEHLLCKLSVISQLRENQERGKASLGAGPEMRVVGLDDAACDLLMRLLAADPAARPTARQVLSHPWLAEVEGLFPPPLPAANPAFYSGVGSSSGGPPGRLHAVYSASWPAFEATLHSTASDLASLGFGPVTPHDDLAPGGLHRNSSNLSSASGERYYDCHSGASSAHPSSSGLAELMAAAAAAAVAAGTGSAPHCAAQQQQQQQQPHPGWQAARQHSGPMPPPTAAAAAAVAPCASAAPGAHGGSFVLADGTTLQLLSTQAACSFLPGFDPGSTVSTALPYQLLGYAVQPLEVVMDGQRLQLSAVHAVYNVDGQPMMCAQPAGVGHAAPQPPPPSHPAPHPIAPAAAAAGAAAVPPAGYNPDFGTSAPILPLLARILQQEH